MNTFKSHYCQEGEHREILLAVFARFCRSSKGAFYLQKISYFDGKEWPIKIG